MRFEDELERTPEIKTYDRSRRFVMLVIAVVLTAIAGVLWFLYTKAERFYWSAEGMVREAYTWGFLTPIGLIGLFIGLFLIVWYTPWLRPVRRRAMQMKGNRIRRKQAKLDTQEERGRQF